jgi:hypothetical protein
LGSEAGVTGFKPFASRYPQTLLVSSAECQGVHSKKFGFEHGIPSLVRRLSRAANYYADSTSFSKRYSDCPPSNSTSKSVRPRFFVTDTSVPSLGNSTPVFGDRIIVVRFSFTPVSIKLELISSIWAAGSLIVVITEFESNRLQVYYQLFSNYLMASPLVVRRRLCD